MAKGSNRKRAPVDLLIGSFVLLGSTRASYPGDWFFGQVLWYGKGDLLVERSTLNGESFRQLCTLSEVRATGAIDQLVAVKEEARKAVAALTAIIHQRENELRDARNDMWGQLDQLVDRGMQVIPPDFEKIDADSDAIRAAAHAVDAEMQAA